MLEIVAAGIALAWLAGGAYLGLGWRGLEGILEASATEHSRNPDVRLPSVSVIIAARNEADSIGGVLEHLAREGYPKLQIVVVDDRSEDDTGRVVTRYLDRIPGLELLTVNRLPEGWLGKTHALHSGYLKSTGEWLCFTDADVAIEKRCLTRSVLVARSRRIDHLCLFPFLETRSFIERIFVTAFAFYFGAYVQPWKAKDPASARSCGVGAFNLIRRETYAAIGGHERLRLEVADDLKLGKLVKAHGYRQEAMDSNAQVSLRWQRGGAGAYLDGIEKNAFAGLDYKVSRVVAGSVCVLMLSVFPFFGLLIGGSTSRAASAIAVAAIALAYRPITLQLKCSRGYFLTHPIGAILLLWGLWRSTVKTFWQGGVRWRGTFYPLKLLKKYRV